MRSFKTLMLAMLLATSAIPASAQDASPSPSASPTPAPQASSASPTSQSGPLKFYLEVSPEDLQQMDKAFQELPKRVADALIQKFNAQIQQQAQINAAREAAMKQEAK